MAISLKVAPDALEQVDVEVKPQPQVQMDMVIRKTMGGHYAIKDHPSYDIVVMPDKNKILTRDGSKINDNIYLLSRATSRNIASAYSQGLCGNKSASFTC